MPPPIPLGEIIQDGDKKWQIGPSIGVDGFGEIYSAREYREDESAPSDDVSGYPYVIKIEPIENGPLFVEMHFYNRNYDKDDIQEFMESNNLSQLGMPTYCGSGSYMFRNEELRFLILERYGTDLWKMFKQVNRKFPAPTVFQLGLQMLDVLDYVHSRSYIHADIKGANILLGIKEGTENQAYLLDFGLAYRIVGDNYKAEPKTAHEGTIEYTSIDRHTGAKTMRGDLEILGYNLLQWLAGTLPWEKVLEDPKKVHKMKIEFMSNVRTRIATDYPDVPDNLIKFFEYIKTLEPQDKPNYTICRNIFETYLTSVGKTRSSQLEFPMNVSEQPSTTNQPETTDDSPLNPKDDSEETKERLENDEQSGDDQQPKVTKPKKNKKDKNLKDTSTVEDEAENEQPDDNQIENVDKNKKNKRKHKKTKEISPEENIVENGQPDDNQEHTEEVTETKRNKRLKKTKDTVPADSDSESEHPDDNLAILKKKKNKRKSDGKTEGAKETESELSDDSQEQPAKKKRKSSKTLTPKKKGKDKTKAKKYQESDSESQFQVKKSPDLYGPLFKKRQPLKKSDLASQASARSNNLRGGECRSVNYAGM